MLAANKYTYLKATNADIDEIEALYDFRLYQYILEDK